MGSKISASAKTRVKDDKGNKSSTRTRRDSSAQPKGALNARGLRSREKLKTAAGIVLNEMGYRNIRIQDVTEQAAVASGLFYHYFRDLRELVAELAEDLFTELRQRSQQVKSTEHNYQWIYQQHLHVVELFAAHPEILACLFGLTGDHPEFDEIWKRNAHEWNLQVAEFLQARAGFDSRRAKDMSFVLGALTEGIVYQSLIRHTEDLVSFSQAPSDTAEVISVMWYRAIFLEPPPKAELKGPGTRLTASG